MAAQLKILTHEMNVNNFVVKMWGILGIYKLQIIVTLDCFIQCLSL